MNNIVRPVITPRTPAVPSDLRRVPEGLESNPFNGRPCGPEWVGKGPASVGIGILVAPAPQGRVMQEGPFRGRRCGEEFIGRREAGLAVLDPMPGSYTSEPAFGEIGRVVTL